MPDTVLLQARRPGPCTAALRSAIEAAGVADRVRLLGRRSDVPDLLAAADVFVFSLLWEGLGGAIIEAMAMGVPVVAFDLPPLSECASDAAVFVGVGESRDLARAVVGLLRDGHLRAELPARGRDAFEARYRMEAVAEEASQYRVVAAGRWPVRRRTDGHSHG